MMEEYKKLVEEQDALMERVFSIIWELSGEAYTEPQRDAMAKWVVNLDITQNSADKALRLLNLRG